LRKSFAVVTNPAASPATNSDPLPFGETGGAFALAFIGEQLDADQARRQSFEQRGNALLASSAGFVTILFGLLAIAARTDERVVAVPHTARLLAVLAMPGLFTAMLAGIAAGFPLKYVVPQTEPLNRLVADDVWRGPGATVEPEVRRQDDPHLKWPGPPCGLAYLRKPTRTYAGLLFYGVVSAQTEKVVEFFLEREAGEAMIDELREDEPALTEDLRVEAIELGLPLEDQFNPEAVSDVDPRQS
jgi:hypothetical protein